MPPRDPRAYLWDAAQAAQAIESFVALHNSESFLIAELVNAAVERKFEIIGEALNQLSKVDPAIAVRVPDLAKIVAFRNQLIHGYAGIERGLVWNIIKSSLAAPHNAPHR
jgi:uncharacterized protein with HEPN domain